MPNDNVDTERYPPVTLEELVNCHSYENLSLVVVTQSGVYGKYSNGGWVRLQPISELEKRR